MQQPYDLPLEQLRVYQPPLTKRPDFDDFWSETLQELAAVPLRHERTPFDYPVKGVRVYRMTFDGFNHAPIEAWLAFPEQDKPLPGIVQYHGYNWAADNQLHETVNLALKGYAVLQMLCRGQQSGSVDNVISSNGHVTGWMTKGILNPKEYYYRAVYMDAVRALEVLRDLPEVDGSRIGVIGGSQGGALTLAAAALSDIPKLALADYPYLSHFERAIDIAPAGPYGELNDYFRRHCSFPEVETKARETLTYFDIMNLAPRIRCHTWIGIGLIDTITPPSTVFAVYNHLACSKEIGIYRYFGHEPIPAAIMPKLKLMMDYLQ
jgi:cephalosporin-C deacetylase